MVERSIVISGSQLANLPQADFGLVDADKAERVFIEELRRVLQCVAPFTPSYFVAWNSALLMASAIRPFIKPGSVVI